MVVAPVDPSKLQVGDIVPARVAGTVYLHLVSALEPARRRVRISNNRGRVKGRTGYERVFGIRLSVDGAPRLGAAEKTRRGGEDPALSGAVSGRPRSGTRSGARPGPPAGRGGPLGPTGCPPVRRTLEAPTAHRGKE
ncbi:hypothetical protein [Streptomyces sp. NRRL B-24484]|uniref:hypothetical protein n=1 Tax=Streptomyces sp. NRRL B-24484 TaxID=1463833 RepID=UPI001F1BA968|nr:hypothetical protein [Streptomyces sp. NRRL B-24484]